jgi:CRP-like cAMP-binding protein
MDIVAQKDVTQSEQEKAEARALLDERILTLSEFGLTQIEIAYYLGTTRGIVSHSLIRLRGLVDRCSFCWARMNWRTSR